MRPIPGVARIRQGPLEQGTILLTVEGWVMNTGAYSKPLQHPQELEVSKLERKEIRPTACKFIQLQARGGERPVGDLTSRK